MNGKALILLALALICGLGAMLGMNQMLSKQKNRPALEMQDVLVAARDLKVEEVVRPDMVKLTQMAKATVPAGTFTSIKDVEDRWVQIKMLEGEPLLDRKLAPKGSPAGMVARIPKGMRAFAIEVNEHTGVSGFILPDHRVDVVQHDTGPNNKAEAETILQDVLVLASGQIFTRPEDRSIQARTVTLAVTPEQVDILVAAQVKGALSLALRGINDHEEKPRRSNNAPKPEPRPEPVVALARPIEPPPPPPPLPPPPPPPPPAAATPHHVTIYRGFKNVERVRIDQPVADDEPSPGAFAGARSELSAPAN
jgi:pilus assembly protein CpaB